MGRDLCKSSHPTLLEQDELKKGVQDFVKWTSEYLQGWRLHNLPGKPIPVFNHPYSKIDLTFKPNFFQPMSLISSLFTEHCCEDPACPSSLLLCHQEFVHKYEASLSLLWKIIALLASPHTTNVPNLSSSFQLFSGLTHIHLTCTDISVPTSALLSRGVAHVLTTICK